MPRVALVLVLPSLLAGVARAAEPTDGQGNIGRTSYATLPFSSQIYAPCWGCSPYLVPGQLYFSANPASIFNNSASMLAARYGSAVMEASGIVPSAGAQRWEDTYAASFPVGTFPNAPSWLASDAISGGFPTDAAFVAWRDFITNHPQYWDVAYDGGTMPEQPDYFRAWGGQWGHISPLTPLDATDCPPGMTACTYGDLFAYQWAQTSGLSGGYGVTMADFTESQPVQSSNDHDFNPRIIAAFAAATGVAVPSGTPATQAQWIAANAQVAWNDYLSQGYGKFFAALAARMGAATGRQALLIPGGSVTPSWRRWVGTDQRILAQYINPANYLCLWDEQVIQVGRGGGPQPSPVMQELAGFAVAAAREPLLRNGASLEADDAAYWAAIASYYPTLSASAQTEIGYKLLKRLWLWSAWAHIADRNGSVRRALAFTARDYWDAGTLTALNPLTKLIQTIMPVQPFGPALYYSTAVERIIEQQAATTVGVGGAVNVYLNNSVLQTFIDSGGVVGYYVSDAALPKIVKGHADAPSAWIVLGADGTLPASERNALAAIAPIVTSRAALASLPNQPLAFTGGLTGFGFYDQNHRLIVVVSNPSSNATAGTLTGMMNLTHLGNTSYTATEQFTGAVTHFTAANSRASVPLSVARWDTQVFVITSP